MPSETEIDVTAIIDRARISRFQWGVLAVCALILFCDNLDIQAIAFTGPSIREDLHLAVSQLGPIFSAAVFGMMFGSMIFGPVADKLGRRPVMIVAVFLFAALSFTTATVNSAEGVLWTRFLAGLGFGGALPNALSLAAEHLPRRNRFFLMTLVGSALGFGSAASGGIAVILVPHYGWRAMYVACGAIALVVGVVLTIWLPESMRFLAARPGNDARIGKALTKIDPTIRYDAGTHFVTSGEARTGVPIRYLFIEKRINLTVPLWICVFVNLMTLFFVVNWVPVFSRQAGLSTLQSILMPLMFNIGAPLGGLAMGFLMDRTNPFRVIGGCFILAAIAMAAMGFVGAEALPLMIVNFCCGFFVAGGQSAIHATGSTLYPTYARVTGIGWTSAMGRVGSLTGPLAGGFLVSLHWAPATILYAVGVPLLAAAIVAFLLANSAMAAADGR